MGIHRSKHTKVADRDEDVNTRPMTRLLALIPEDGFAMLREGETIFFVRPPFTTRVEVSEATLADAIAIHGYDRQPAAPKESWEAAIERVRGIMAGLAKDLPSNAELLARLLKVLPKARSQ
jgi:hypothetical protein